MALSKDARRAEDLFNSALEMKAAGEPASIILDVLVPEIASLRKDTNRRWAEARLLNLLTEREEANAM